MAELETEIEIRVHDVEKVKKFLAEKYNKTSPDEIIEMNDQYFKESEFKENGTRYRLRTRLLPRPETYIVTIKKPETDGSGVQSAMEEEGKYKTEGDAYSRLKITKGVDRPWVDERLLVERYGFDEFHVDIRRVQDLFDYVEIEGDKDKIVRFSDELKEFLGKSSWEKLPDDGAFGLVRKMRDI